MAEPWQDLADSIVSTVTERARDFLEGNPEAKKFLKERSLRLGKLAWKYKTAASDEERDTAERDMKIVQQSIENELATIALDGSDEAKAVFKQILKTAVGVFIRAVPSLLTIV